MTCTEAPEEIRAVATRWRAEEPHSQRVSMMMALGVVWAGGKGGEWIRVALPVSRGQQMRELHEQAAARTLPRGVSRRAMMGEGAAEGWGRREERGGEAV